MNWYELKQFAKEQLEEAITENGYDDIEDGIYELVDGLIPVYYGELLELCKSSNDLDFVDIHNPPSSIESIYDIISWNVFNELIAFLYQELEENYKRCDDCDKWMIDDEDYYYCDECREEQ